MSAITGKGYGDQHSWQNRGTEQINSPKEFRSTFYVCAKYNEHFRHYYHITPDIFEEMRKRGVKEDCQ